MQYTLTVSELNKYIKAVISSDILLSDLWIKGEISNFKHHYSGHMFFTLKDSSSVLKCVMFKTQNCELSFTPKNGMKVIIHGAVSAYERDGQYQLYAEEMQQDGIGNLYVAFTQLRLKLEQEGLFNQTSKKRLPFLPKSIGVITSKTGSVIHDIINILNRRFDNFCIKVYSVPVQGELAAAKISNAIRILNRAKCVDVIILARGGGSLEELWAFNQESVARSIFNSTIPIISAIGHETDYTISDFVADMRVPTPSAAAEIVMPEKIVIKQELSILRKRLTSGMSSILLSKKAYLCSIMQKSSFSEPYGKIYQERMKISIIRKMITKEAISIVRVYQLTLNSLLQRLEALNPLAVLSRGFVLVKLKKTGTFVKSVDELTSKDEIILELNDGQVRCIVTEILNMGTLNEGYGQKKILISESNISNSDSTNLAMRENKVRRT